LHMKFKNLINKKNIFFINVIASIIYCLGYAQELVPEQQASIEQNIFVEQQLKQQREAFVREQKIKELEKIRQQELSENQENPINRVITDNGATKFISSIILENNKVISSTFIYKNFINKYINTHITTTDLKNIKDRITNHYFQKGYISTRVYFDIKEINQGILKIIIEEGRLEQIILTDNSAINEKLNYRRFLQKTFAFGGQKEVLNLRDIEQGLDQINRLQSNQAQMQVEAGTKPGYSNILVNNNTSFLPSISYEHDNAGSKSTGKYQDKLSLSQDNLIGVNDNLYASYTTTNNRDKNNRYSKSIYVSTSLPFGYYTIGGSYSYSKYLVTTQGFVTSFKSSGATEDRSMYISRLISRGKDYKISFKTELASGDGNNYIENTYIPISSRRLTTLKFSLNSVYYMDNAWFYIDSSYTQGLTAVGALKDEPFLDQATPKAQSRVYNINGVYSRQLTFPKATLPVNYKLTFNAQYSEDTLYSNQQLNIGGRYSVRGFDENQIRGDIGYYILNDISINMGSLVPNYLAKDTLFNSPIIFQKSLNDYLMNMSLGVFYDYGYARSKVIQEISDEGYMSGVGINISYNSKNINWGITYSRGLHSPNFLREEENSLEDKESLYFNISFNIP